MSTDYSPKSSPTLYNRNRSSLVVLFTTSIITAFTMTSQDNRNEEKVEHRIEKVFHDYHDYANEAEKGEGSLENLQHQHVEEHTQSSSLNRGEQNFPVMLHYMLNELEKDGMDNIVSWQPHGRCFLVHKQQQFLEHVLPL
jgi:hypothetical protein